MRFDWPSTQFVHVGEFASSKSAMKTFAPELSALITILRSTGPVISTRRSWRSAGVGATRQLGSSRTCCVSGRKSGSSPASIRACRSSRRSSSSARRGPSSRCKRGDEGEGVRSEDALSGLTGIREHFHAGRERRSHRHRLTRVGLPRAFTEAVEAALPQGAVLTEHEELRTYECDGLTGRRVIPGLVCLPETTEQVQAVVRACAAHGIPFVARGAGTGLSGGALPVAEGIVISLARMNRVLDIDLDNQRVVVQPGVTNLQVTEVVAAEGFYYAPDPSSQQVCTIGGNLAENSGGAHCLKYGFTVNHVLAAVVVLPNGDVVTLSADDSGPGSPGRVRRLRGDARHRDRGDAARAAPSRAGGDAAGGLRLDRRGRCRRVGDRRARGSSRRRSR